MGRKTGRHLHRESTICDTWLFTHLRHKHLRGSSSLEGLVYVAVRSVQDQQLALIHEAGDILSWSSIGVTSYCWAGSWGRRIRE